jgi:hypothetical protein
MLSYWFTGKELDSETGFYYYGARYLDPKTSRWISADPALGDYIPGAPVDDEAKKRNGSLPGQGGVFNYVNLHVYHYAGNNPVKYVDPDGEEGIPFFTPEEFLNTLSQIDPVAKLLNLFRSVMNSDQLAQNHLSSLTKQMLSDAGDTANKVADNALVTGMTFMSENGAMISLACYATGFVEIGLVVDGVTVASNVALDYRSFLATGDRKQAFKDILKNGISFFIPYETGRAVTSQMNKIQLSNRDIEIITSFAVEMESIAIDKTLKALND